MGNEMYVSYRFDLTTAQAERDLFTGEVRPQPVIKKVYGWPTATYRVLDGEVFRILPGVPPGF